MALPSMDGEPARRHLLEERLARGQHPLDTLGDIAAGGVAVGRDLGQEPSLPGVPRGLDDGGAADGIAS